MERCYRNRGGGGILGAVLFVLTAGVILFVLLLPFLALVGAISFGVMYAMEIRAKKKIKGNPIALSRDEGLVLP